MVGFLLGCPHCACLFCGEHTFYYPPWYPLNPFKIPSLEPDIFVKSIKLNPSKPWIVTFFVAAIDGINA